MSVFPSVLRYILGKFCLSIYWGSFVSPVVFPQVLLDTTQLYYYFFHKTPHMVFKRALMVLAASLEFEKGHNPEIVVRYSVDKIAL